VKINITKVGEAICIKCGPKPRSHFTKNKKHKNGLQSKCKKCANEDAKLRYKKDNGDKMSWNMRKYRYGITKNDFMKLKDKQFGLCTICYEKLPEDKKIHVDHDHETGKVRGLLCPRCNIAVGIFENNKNLIGNIVDYLL